MQELTRLSTLVEQELQDLRAEVETRIHEKGHKYTYEGSSRYSSVNKSNTSPMPIIVVYKSTHDAKEVDSFLITLPDFSISRAY